jgi:uncharacterized protein (DUF488 family)
MRFDWRSRDAVKRPPVYTVGHSTRRIAEFVELLRQGQVDLVVDIRSTPRSRTNPQFNLDALPEGLAAWQIGHVRIAELGGRRKKSKIVPPEVNGFWTNQSFHNYADYALSDEFRAGLARMAALNSERRCAIMCSEAVWWRCHRRFVADHLLHAGRDVFHLMGAARADVAKMNPAAHAKALRSPIQPRKEDFGTHSPRRAKASLIYEGPGIWEPFRSFLLTPGLRVRLGTQ